jgi:hypothetical protein
MVVERVANPAMNMAIGQQAGDRQTSPSAERQ